MTNFPRRVSGSERAYGAGIPILVTAIFLLAIAAIFVVWLTRDLEEDGAHSAGTETSAGVAGSTSDIEKPVTAAEYNAAVDAEFVEMRVALTTLGTMVSSNMTAESLAANRDGIIAATDRIRETSRTIQSIEGPEEVRTEKARLDAAMADLDTSMNEVADAARAGDVQALLATLSESLPDDVLLERILGVN